MRVVTVLQTKYQLSCDFAPKHVQLLQAQVKKWTDGNAAFTCFSDVDVPGVERTPLKYRWMGWYAKMEIFRPDIEFGDFLYIDLDTLIVGPIHDFFSAGRFTGLRDPNPKCFGSGLLYIPERDRADIWADFSARPEDLIQEYGRRGMRWDAGLMERQQGGKAQIWEDFLPGQLVDIRQVRHSGVPDSARMVICHSRPRPWNDPCLRRFYK